MQVAIIGYFFFAKWFLTLFYPCVNSAARNICFLGYIRNFLSVEIAIDNWASLLFRIGFIHMYSSFTRRYYIWIACSRQVAISSIIHIKMLQKSNLAKNPCISRVFCYFRSKNDVCKTVQLFWSLYDLNLRQLSRKYGQITVNHTHYTEWLLIRRETAPKTVWHWPLPVYSHPPFRVTTERKGTRKRMHL